MSAGMWVAVVGMALIGTAALVWLFATTRTTDDSEYDRWWLG